MNGEHPVRFAVDYPDRPLDRLTTAFRVFTVIPIAIVLGSIGGYASGDVDSGETSTIVIGGTGLLFLPPLLMIVFRQKYPRWWFDWNLELLRFTNRVGAYFALMNDRYPATDEAQSVRLDFPYPDARRDLNRWLPLVKWLLAIPHYIALAFLYLAVLLVLIVVWFAILFTGRYPRGLFEFVEGVIRWHNRVVAYAFILVTDRYPPFSLAGTAPAASGGRPDLDALLAAFNARDPDRILELFTDDCVFDTPADQRLVGKEQVRGGFQARFDGIPDIVYGDARHFTSGDRGASEWTIRGTRSTGEPIEVRGCDLFEFTGGKISRKDSYWKSLG